MGSGVKAFHAEGTTASGKAVSGAESIPWCSGTARQPV